MQQDIDSMDLFCRINVLAEMPHEEFVAFIARSVGGANRMNSVRSQALDILVDENDGYDAEKAHTGKNRWLYFRYTLEIDPIAGVEPKDYMASISALLKTLWSSCMEAVALCDFEDLLAKNERRLKWATA